MADESIKRVLGEVAELCADVASQRRAQGNLLATLNALSDVARMAKPETARAYALTIMAELAASLADAERAGDEIVAKVGR